MKISLSRCIHSSTWFPRFYNPISSSHVWSCACNGTRAKVISGFNGHREYQQPFTSDRENCHDQSCNYNLRICFNSAYVRVTARSRNLNYAITRGTVSVTQIINEEICCTRTACDYSSSPALVSVISLFRLIAYSIHRFLLRQSNAKYLCILTNLESKLLRRGYISRQVEKDRSVCRM